MDRLGKFLVLSLVFGVTLFEVSPRGMVSAQSACPSSFAGLTREELEAALAICQSEINQVQGVLDAERKKSASYASEVAALNASITKATLEINKRNASIQTIAEDITSKSTTIVSLSDRIDREKDSLAQLIRRTEEMDSYTLTEVLLSGKRVSDFFSDIDSFGYINEEISASLYRVATDKAETENAKRTLEEKRNQEIDARKAKEQEQKRIEADQAEKARLLAVTKGNEALYQKDLQEKQKRAEEIRAILFPLRDSGEISFGLALDYANEISAKTGIRPAFLLAIFQQESGFGRNVGSCYLRVVATGAGVGKNTGTVFEDVMKPDRDVEPFLNITKRLGLDPFNTPVSCPQTGGYGGAMGPAQFIPSTWILFESRIMKALGTTIANPWHARDAFTAAGLYLTDLGADPKSYTSERNAACRYFSGRRCADLAWAASYGDQVMAKAEVLQTTIDSLR